MCRLGLPAPLIRPTGRHPAAPGFPVSGSALELVAQQHLKPVYRLTGGDTLYLGPDRTSVDIQIGLGNHGTGDRRIGMLGQPDPGVEYGLIDEVRQCTDLSACVLAGVM
jgi:hypothetical protein